MAEKKSYTVALITLTSLFFMWGFITCMNDILIPHLKGVFNLNYFQAFLIQGAFFGAYFIGSVIYFFLSRYSGDPINRIGYKNGIIIGLLISAFGTALFFPAAEIKSYAFFLSALFILGLGLTMLQIAANPYVSILGDEKSASSRLNLSQGFNSLGTTLAPLIGGYFVFKYFFSESMPADSVKIPYLIFSAVFLSLAIIIKFIKLPRFTGSNEIEKSAGALKYPHLVLGMAAIFMYVGAEVTVGSLLINFLGLDIIMGLPEEDASVYVAVYWGGLMIGRFMGAISLSNLSSTKKQVYMLFSAIVSFFIIYLAIYIKESWSFSKILPYVIFIGINYIAFYFGRKGAAKTLFVFSLIASLLLVFAIFTTGLTAAWCLIGIGIFNSIMWSNIFTLAIRGLGKYTGQGSSLLVMMIVGGGIIPPITGALADIQSIGLHKALILPVVAYLYLAYYGLTGYKQKKNNL